MAEVVSSNPHHVELRMQSPIQSDLKKIYLLTSLHLIKLLSLHVNVTSYNGVSTVS